MFVHELMLGRTRSFTSELGGYNKAMFRSMGLTTSLGFHQKNN